MRAFLSMLMVPVLVFIFSSCQKEITGEVSRPTDTTGAVGTPGGSFLVKTYTEDLKSSAGNLFTKFNLSYDVNNRILSVVSSTNAGDKFLYQYGVNKYSLEIFNSNVLSIHGDFFLNSNQLPDSNVQYNDTRDTTIEKYTYNAAKQLTQSMEYEIKQSLATLIDRTLYEYDANGNVSKETNSGGETTYTYTSLLNTLNTGQVYSNQNKFLIKTTVISGVGGVTINHTHTFDSFNRLTSEKAVATNGDVVTRTYTY
ncbi:MAG: hypothetical protein LH478_03780 [Chitinophagaceae bacterium]|nr:hypothetical protein [Chitinophagaceae bacterium]